MLNGLFIGLFFGFILQRSQFCFVSGLRQLYPQKNLRFLTALFIAISIQSIGFFALAQFNFIHIPTSQLPIVATLLGGFLFGMGMILAGCCACGSWFRSGEGLIGSFTALIFFAITMAATQTGALKSWILPLTQDVTEMDNIHTTLQISPWWLVVLLCVITVMLIYYHHKHPRYQPTPDYRYHGLRHWIAEKRISLNIAAVIIGLLGIVAWFDSSLTGREFGFSISVPSANVVQYIVTGQQRYLNWGSYFVLGIPLGAFISAKLSGEFKLNVPEPKLLLRRALGGIVMAIGAALAGGCTITNALVATAYFSWQGWLATLMICLGCWITAYFIKPTQCKI
ncbi:YeeE/YedE family protein [Lonepinella koalarum]|uniref:YeeE/YedE family protein n=1 Tax=Lonepinella koalarum TaxID=53417 RepID=UPI0011E4B7A3|nr:YeeE/YedE family protein [Lonepinella koalarum]TYG33962.1 YeeE/YedE family protein [Lonepinella koalarum]